MPNRKLLLSLHGLNTPGDWQEQVASVLNKHFDYQEVKRHKYRRLGFLKNVIDPICLLAAIVIVVLAVPFAPSHVWSLLLIPPVLGLGFYLAERRRIAAVREYMADYQSRSEHSRDQLPSIIAHSFGTYLVARSLQTYQAAMVYDRILLWGSVIPRSFNWNDHVGSLRRVRNEIASKDLVVRLARFGGLLLGHFGDSGATGFSLKSPLLEEETFHAFRHSSHIPTAFVGHARLYWFPFLLGLSGEEYRRFLFKARVCSDLLHRDDEDSIDVAEFDQAQWAWTRKGGAQLSFKEFVEQKLRDQLDNYGLPLRLVDNQYPIARLYICEQAADDVDPRMLIAEVCVLITRLTRRLRD